MVKIVIIEPESGFVDKDLIAHTIGSEVNQANDVAVITCGDTITADDLPTAIVVGECIATKAEQFKSLQYVDLDGDYMQDIIDLLESNLATADSTEDSSDIKAFEQ